MYTGFYCNRKWLFSNLKHDCTLQDGSILSSLGELLSLVKSQQQDISELRQQLNMYQADQQQKISAVVHEVQMIDERVSTRLGNALAEFSREACIQLSSCTLGVGTILLPVSYLLALKIIDRSQ